MGWRSTLTVNRAQAILAIKKKLNNASDLQLAEVLLDLYVDSHYNFIVAPGHHEGDNETLEILSDSDCDDSKEI